MDEVNRWLNFARQTAGTAGELYRGFNGDAGPSDRPAQSDQEKKAAADAALGVAPWYTKTQNIALIAGALLLALFLWKKS